ncbi:MAG: peptidoglycan DD-metalloendopeptidase family protein, partial [Acidobacteriota bacterium]|nr:peptidoglycan DD-metalloendopeptidase family protein [Acidobacteriota bacterium]
MRRALVLVVLLFLLWAPGAYAWTWPVQGPVLLGFVFDASHPYAGGQHRGIDIGSSPGSGVVAPAAGTVSFAGTVPTSGKSVTIATADGYSVTLTHLGSIDVAKGASVGEGQGIGTVGPSGTPELDVPYLYLGVRVTAEAQGYLDPLSFLPALPPPVAPEPAPGPAPAPPPPAAAEPAAPAPAVTTTGTPDPPAA